jgi:hypothetical protein
MKKKYYWIAGVIVIICLIFIMIITSNLSPSPSYWSYPYSIQNEWKICNEDNDCSLADTGCCIGCGYSNLSLNRVGIKTIEDWKSFNCKDVLCPQVDCRAPITIPKPICLNNICSVKYNLDYESFCGSYCRDFECYDSNSSSFDYEKEYLKDELKKTNVTFEEAKSHCYKCAESCPYPNPEDFRAEIGIIILGETQRIPSYIGITNRSKIAKLYTLSQGEGEAVGHIYKSIEGGATLGEFFDAWDKNFNSTCIFNYCNNKDHKMKMEVCSGCMGGWTSDKENFEYENYVIKKYDVITITYL